MAGLFLIILAVLLQLIFGSEYTQVYCFLKKVERSVLLGSSTNNGFVIIREIIHLDAMAGPR